MVWKSIIPEYLKALFKSMPRRMRALFDTQGVRDAFVKVAENRVMQDLDASYVVYTGLVESKNR